MALLSLLRRAQCEEEDHPPGRLGGVDGLLVF